MGGSDHHATRSRRHHSVISDCAKHERVRRLGRVRTRSVCSLSCSDKAHFRRTKKKDIYVISTPKRPVPLEHFLYAGKELHKIVDSRGVFDGQG